MLTFKKTKETILLGNVIEKNTKKPLFWHPKREEEFLIPPDFDRYMHSKSSAIVINYQKMMLI